MVLFWLCLNLSFQYSRMQMAFYDTHTHTGLLCTCLQSVIWSFGHKNMDTCSHFHSSPKYSPQSEWRTVLHRRHRLKSNPPGTWHLHGPRSLVIQPCTVRQTALIMMETERLWMPRCSLPLSITLRFLVRTSRNVLPQANKQGDIQLKPLDWSWSTAWV